VGSAIGRALTRLGHAVVAVGGGRGESAGRLAAELDADPIAPPFDRLGHRARLVLVTPPDRLLAETAALLQAHAGLRPGALLVQCSATEPAAVLGAGGPGHAGPDTAEVHRVSLHPLRPFPDRERDLEHFDGVFFAIEGEESAVSLGGRLARALGGRPAKLEAGDKALYHAAGVLAATGVMGLADAVYRIADRIGLDETFLRAGLLPLMRHAVDAVDGHGLPDGLTGPISRGDVGVVSDHIEALRRQAPDLLPLYLEVARRNLSIARTGDTAASGLLDELERLLEDA
jgi:predicted short-subunit dehydrogenase-like oxidoreductase (DUF2520 family)